MMLWAWPPGQGQMIEGIRFTETKYSCNIVKLCQITVLRVIPTLTLTHDFDILSGIQFWYRFWHAIWHRFSYSTWHSFWHLIWHVITFFSYFFSGSVSGILFGMCSGPGVANCIQSWEEDRSGSARGTQLKQWRKEWVSCSFVEI